MLICVDSLFLLISWARGLSIWFIFSKNQILVSMIFSIVLFYSILFISSLIFIMSLLLLTLGLICSSFSSFNNYEFRLFIWDCSSFFKQAWIAIYFPLRTAFAVSHRSWGFVLLLSFVSIYFLICILIWSLIHWLFRSMLLSLHVFVSLFVFLI